MTKLTDTQTVLLSAASQRESGSPYPLPATLRPGGAPARSIAAHAGTGLAEERKTSSADTVSRTDGEPHRLMADIEAALREQIFYVP